MFLHPTTNPRKKHSFLFFDDWMIFEFPSVLLFWMKSFLEARISSQLSGNSAPTKQLSPNKTKLKKLKCHPTEQRKKKKCLFLAFVVGCKNISFVLTQKYPHISPQNSWQLLWVQEGTSSACGTYHVQILAQKTSQKVECEYLCVKPKAKRIAFFTQKRQH